LPEQAAFLPAGYTNLAGTSNCCSCQITNEKHSIENYQQFYKSNKVKFPKKFRKLLILKLKKCVM